MNYIFSSVVAVLSLAAATHADLIAYEAFNHPEISVSIVGQESGIGFDGKWKSWGGAPNQTNLKIAEGSLSYPGLLTEGNHVIGGSLNGNWVGLSHDLETPSDETTTKYLSFLMRPEEVGSGSFGVMIDGTKGSDIAIGKSPSSSGRYMIETFFNTATQSSDVRVESGVTSFMVVKAELTEGRDTFTLFVNPTPGEPEPETGILKRGADIGQVKGIGIGAGGNIRIDELRWADTYADVAPMIMSSVVGDFNGDGLLTTADIDLFGPAVGGSDVLFDLDGNGTVEQEDRRVWVEDVFGSHFGDADLNKKVEFADFLALSNSFTASGGWLDGDFDGSGDVQFADFLLLSANFGNSASAVAAVPEPSGFSLIYVAAIGFGLVRKRRVRS